MFHRRAAAVSAAVLLGLLAASPASAHSARSSEPPPDNVAGKQSSKQQQKGKRAVQASAARTDNRSKPILFLHGLDAVGDAGADCNTFAAMRDRLRAWGHTGALTFVKYYWADTNCTKALDGYGSHTKHFPRTDAHQNGSHDMDGDIRHLAYHLAWMIYTDYSSKGVHVDLVGHSMGGLIIRYMLDQNERNGADFPPYLYVEDVVTLGTPHGGSGYASWCGWAYQCQQMAYGSSFMTYLSGSATHPDGDGGTNWTTMGSYDDGVVAHASAVQMAADHKVKYLGTMDVGHSDYQARTSDVRDADVEYSDNGGPWYAWYDAPHAVRWSDFGLTYGSW